MLYNWLKKINELKKIFLQIQIKPMTCCILYKAIKFEILHSKSLDIKSRSVILN